MKERFIVFLTTIILLFIVVGCGSENNNETDNSSNNNNDNSEANENTNNNNDNEENDESNEEEDILTEQILLENLLEEANKYTDRMLKDESYTIGIDSFDTYEFRSYKLDDEIEIKVIDSSVEVEFEKDKEDYELPNGLKGTIGDVGSGYISFVHYDDDLRTEVKMDKLGIDDAKDKLDALDFRNEDFTEDEIKEDLGFDYEDAHFFDNEGTDYDVSELWIRNGYLKSFQVRYRNNDADEYDAIDISVSAEEFEIDELRESEEITTEGGKDVVVVDDGFFVEWLWEEDDGYFYKISGNYDEDEVEEKEYRLEVIDNMSKEYGE